jgi:hypothetical protein
LFINFLATKLVIIPLIIQFVGFYGMVADRKVERGAGDRERGLLFFNGATTDGPFYGEGKADKRRNTLFISMESSVW